MAVGRTTLFKKEITRQAVEMAKLGLTLKQIAQVLGIGERTFKRWLACKGELRHAISISKEVADREIEKSLFNRAKGFEYKERYFEVDPITKRQRLVKVIKKFIPPETSAISLWLLNRQRLKWKDIRRIAISGDRDAPPIVFIPVPVKKIEPQGKDPARLPQGNEQKEKLIEG